MYVPQTEACPGGLCWLKEGPARVPDSAPAFLPPGLRAPSWLLQDAVLSKLPERRRSTPIIPRHWGVSGITRRRIYTRGRGPQHLSIAWGHGRKLGGR